ncbi:MAG: hypothetical protein BGO90_15695 [Legionella sp. 40-6]|nr:hypothetical protein [Legionella sp.]OJX94566.1 MAG: hypothetical protein BGO90_15695 [Legionella sp. 40-6]
MNHAFSFSIKPLFCEAVTNPSFKSNYQTTLTYGLGVGIQKVLIKNWQMGVGYEFTDWGKIQFKRAPGQLLNQGLGFNHLYTNGVLFNLSYLA